MHRRFQEFHLINFTFYETFKDERISHKNFTFLGQGSYEITGGGGSARPPLVSDVVPKPLISEGLNWQKCAFNRLWLLCSR